jgi:hypothetical protein
MMKSLIYMIFTVCAILTCSSFAAPQPAIVQGPGEWTIDVTFEHPQLILLQRADGKTARFWYIILTLTNNTNDDVDFYPNCELMTDTFQIIPAGKNVPTEVFKQIKSRLKSRYPLLESLEKVDNRILQGQNNAKDIAIIWPDFDSQAKNIKIFISGLSNETVAIDHPVKKDESGNPIKVYLRKTLELSYSLRSDPARRTGADISYQGKRWIMR